MRKRVYNCLLDMGITSLPVDTRDIAERFGITLSKNKEVNMLASDEMGLCYYTGTHWFIFYDESLDESTLRSVFAHELGHILSEHDVLMRTSPKKLRPYYLHRNELVADEFALRLVAPLCILEGMQITSAKELADVCGIPQKAAIKRFRRLQTVRKNDRFFENVQEAQLYCAFFSFIALYCTNHEKDLFYATKLFHRAEAVIEQENQA